MNGRSQQKTGLGKNRGSQHPPSQPCAMAFDGFTMVNAAIAPRSAMRFHMRASCTAPPRHISRLIGPNSQLQVFRRRLVNAASGLPLPASGTSTDGREELATLLQFLRDGDTLVVTRIDRLAGSLRDLQNIVHDLRQRGVTLKATEQPIDTSTAAGKCFLDMLGVFAEFETNLRKERQLEGIAKAKAAGIYKGRKRKVPIDEVKQLKEAGRSISEIAETFDVSRMAIYRALAR